MKLEMYGHYYRMFKGTGGVPTKVTVVGIEGDTVTLVRGHYTKEDFEEVKRLTDKLKKYIYNDEDPLDLIVKQAEGFLKCSHENW